MKTNALQLHIILIFLAILTGCGISKEVRLASNQLVESQESSVLSQTEFHTIVIGSLTMILDAENLKSELQYKESVEILNSSLLEEIKKIYSNDELTLAEQKVREEEARQTVAAELMKAEKNRIKRNELIKQSKENLVSASQSIITAENLKLKVIKNLNGYLQAKRPSETILELINIDLNEYSKYIGDARHAISQAETIMEKFDKF